MDFLRGLSQTIKAAEARNSADAFAELATTLVTGKDRVREELQALTAEKIKEIIRKLEKNQELSPEEKDYVELWVVGDAQGYAQREDSLKERLEEFRRLAALIQDYEQAPPASPPQLVKLHGVLEEAVKTADAIAHFLEDRDRVERFRKAVNQLDAADSKLIADILKSSLASADM